MATRVPLIVNAIANQIQELPVGDSLVGITTVTATTFIGAGTIPVGGIIMWSGTIAAISSLTGWALCNGSNGTPDLRNRFIVGAHSGVGIGTSAIAGPGITTNTATNPDYTPGNVGGETSHQLTIEELASHTHTFVNAPGIVTRSEGGNGSSIFSNPFTGTTSSTGSSNFHENRPPYYALAFIMRTL